MKKYLLILALMAFCARSSAQDVEEYISDNLAISQCLMREHNIPASIILSVAIHESAAGTSKIAKHLNNHFGIKGKNSSTTIKSAYKDFDTIEDSYKYFIEYLITKPKYAQLFSTLAADDFKSWARGIHKGGYAASKTWSNQIIHTINKYQLHKYDDAINGSEPTTETVSIPEKTLSVYIVKKSDNLSMIARKLGITINHLKLKNKLKSIVLQPGQKLYY